jgi:hypothetical protein
MLIVMSDDQPLLVGRQLFHTLIKVVMVLLHFIHIQRVTGLRLMINDA